MEAPPRGSNAATTAISLAVVWTVVVTIAAVVGIAVASHDSSSGSNKASTVKVTLRDFSIGTDRVTVAGGLVDFAVGNAGPSPHELVAFQSDAPPESLPVDADGRVSEEDASLVKAVDSGDSITPTSGIVTIHAALLPGNYVLVCNIADHYKRGMRLALTVI